MRLARRATEYGGRCSVSRSSKRAEGKKASFQALDVLFCRAFQSITAYKLKGLKQALGVLSQYKCVTMADHDRRNGGSRGAYQNRKRRYRGRLAHAHTPPPLFCSPHQADVYGLVEDDDYDRRPQRRRYEEPVYVRLRKELLGLAESVSAREPPTDRGKLTVL